MANLRALPTTPLLSANERKEYIGIDIDAKNQVLASQGPLTHVAQFLDAGSVASFIFTNKSTFQLLGKIQPEKRNLLKQVMKHNERIKQIDNCETAIRTELKSTWMYKTAGHLSWILPIGSPFAGISVAIYKLSEYEAACATLGLVMVAGLVTCIDAGLPCRMYNATFDRLNPVNKSYTSVLSAETVQQITDIEVQQGNPTVRVILADLNQLRQLENQNCRLKLTQLGATFFMKNSVADEKANAAECSDVANNLALSCGAAKV